MHARALTPFALVALLAVPLSVAVGCGGAPSSAVEPASPEPASSSAGADDALAPLTPLTEATPGALVLADWHDDGRCFLALVTGADAEVADLLAPDATRTTLPLARLYADRLGVGARVIAWRADLGEAARAVVARRVGSALEVAFEDEHRAWLSLASVWIVPSELAAAPPFAPAATEAPFGEVGSRVLARREGTEGLLLAVVIASAPDGNREVLLADGTSATLPLADLRPDTIDAGSEIHLSGFPQPATVLQRAPIAIEARGADGMTTWSPLSAVRAAADEAHDSP